MQVQFEYRVGPDDVRAMHQHARFRGGGSRALYVSWLVGWAITAIVLAEMQMWFWLQVNTILVAMVFALHAQRRRPYIRKKREEVTRRVTVDRVKVLEEVSDSWFVKSWKAIQETNETRTHFVLYHYHAASVYPKRAMTKQQCEQFRQLIADHSNDDRPLAEYVQWFGGVADGSKEESSQAGADEAGLANPVRHGLDSTSRATALQTDSASEDLGSGNAISSNSNVGSQASSKCSSEPTGVMDRVFRFTWSDDDVGNLRRYGVRPFMPGAPISSMDVKRPGWVGKLIWLVLVFFVGMFFLKDELPLARFQPRDFAIGVPAVFAPFLLGYLVQRILLRRSSRQPNLFPPYEASIRLVPDALMMGFAYAVGRYSLSDIKQFFVSEYFVGFQTSFNNQVQVVVARAFGGLEGAVRFLNEAERLRLSVTSNKMTENVDVIETGNPFQAPSS